ncbi:MAG TPA: SUMF1/EgtB/PvdO family nonheme iron enzyme [Candidatus Limnocylindrales bacterium]|nr:SUMF1/EgtB/PvdO family nonheme iron enzyme [Candidatus Limnocylindrales bacterium]
MNNPEKYLPIVFIFILYLFWTISIDAADIYNPKPQNDDFILPMPNQAKMVFRRVFIGKGDKPFALREFKVGDRSGGGFKEFPTSVILGGAFVENNLHNQPDWVYYMGKYEVTEAQYYAVVDPGKAGDSQKPITNISWFEAQEFINKYNLWLFENALDKLPRNDKAVGFLRLPTESEWEFAARGGSEVQPLEFDKKYPYTGPLSKYEWFAGPTSSHGKIKDIGLREPNPLGIHDMLGNVSEMTGSLYQIEYYQGRVGGFVARGGHVHSEESALRSSLRTEIPFYQLNSQGKITQTRQETLGMRLVISSQIFTGLDTNKKLEEAWVEYVKSRATPVQPALTIAPITIKTNAQLADAEDALKRLTDELTALDKSSGVIPPTVWNHLGLLSASFKNIEATVNKAENDSAYAWVKIAAEAAFFINRELKRLPRLQDALKTAESIGRSAQTELIKGRVAETEQNIEGGLTRYGSAFEQLAKIKEDTVNQAFEEYNNYLKLQGADEQIKVNTLVKKHFQEYLRTRRSNKEQWEADLKNL